MADKRHIGDHRQQVKHGQPGQDTIHWGAHVFAREHRYVEHVHWDAKCADDEAEDAMHWSISFPDQSQSGLFHSRRVVARAVQSLLTHANTGRLVHGSGTCHCKLACGYSLNEDYLGNKVDKQYMLITMSTIRKWSKYIQSLKRFPLVWLNFKGTLWSNGCSFVINLKINNKQSNNQFSF